MIIQCPGCGKQYKVDPEKIPEKGARLTCQSCGHIFAIRKKKESGTTPAKTPPCQICGAPSTRVLKSDPPMILCEKCFEREKEKTRRMLAPDQTDAKDGMPSVSPQEKPVFPEHPASATEFSPGTEFVVESKKGAEKKLESPETQYFDSFAEIPDLDGYHAKAAEGSEVKPEKSEAELMNEFKKFKKIEEPVFDETGFEAHPEAKLEKAPEKPAQSPEEPLQTEPSAFSQKPKESEEPSPDEFVFSPREVEHLEDTSKIKPAYLREKIETGPSPLIEKKEAELDKEIFGEVAEQKKPEEPEKPAPLFRKSLKTRLPRIPLKTALGISAIALALVGGYFVITHQKSFFSPKAGNEQGTQIAEKALSEEDQRILQEHLTLAKELYHLDTQKSYMEALAQIRSAFKIDKNSISANALNMLVSGFLAQKSPGFISLSRARAQAKKSNPELMQEPDFQAGRALLAIAEKNYPTARVMAEKLIEQHPDYSLGYWIMAQIQLTGAIKKFAEAETMLKKAIELDPKLVQARVSLAELYIQQAQNQEALQEFQEVLKLSPEHTQAQARVKELQSLLAQAKPSEEKPSGMLLVQPAPGAQVPTTATPQTGATAIALIPIKPGTSVLSGETSVSPPLPKVDFNQEFQNFILNVISETRQPMSRSRVFVPSTTPVAPTPAPVPNRPPEQAPSPPPTSRPPEEAP